jgi:hypothetical protein
MSSTLVKVNEDGSEDRCFRLLVDSRNALDHDNTNPSEYTVSLPETLTGVTRIRLTGYSIIMSAQYVFIRASGWFASGATADSTSRHVAEVIGRDALPPVEKEGAPITIYNVDGTVQLQVVQAFTKTITATNNSDFRIYTVYLCTGRMESTTFSTDTYYISDATNSNTFSVPLQISGVGSDDGSSYSSSRTVTSSITITTLRSEAFLRVWANTLPLTRLSMPAKAFPTWASYEVYRPGDLLSYRPTFADDETDIVTYECVRSHFALIFADDSANWQSITTTTDIAAKTNGIFYMVRPDDTNEHITTKEFKRDQVVYETPKSTTVSEIKIKWQTRKGSDFIFPSFGTLNVTSLETSPYAYARKVFQHHQLEFEFDYNIAGR